MSQKVNPFDGAKSYTVEQFKVKCNFTKIKVRKVMTAAQRDAEGNRIAGTSEPVFYKNPDGTPTAFQKIAIADEAGNTQALMSRDLAKKVYDNGNAMPAGIDLKFQEYFYDAHNPETGELIEDKMGVVLMEAKQSPNEFTIAGLQ